MMHFWNWVHNSTQGVKKGTSWTFMDPEQEKYLSYGKEFFSLMGPWFYTSITVSCLYDTSCTFMDPQGQKIMSYRAWYYVNWVHDCTWDLDANSVLV